jgi:hypothetical protein
MKTLIRYKEGKMTGDTYLFIGLIHALAIGAAMLLNILLQLAHIAILWTTDTKMKYSTWGCWIDRWFLKRTEPIDGVDFTVLTILIPLGGAFAIILVWPLLFPTLFVIGGLFATRGFIRFRKKVNKVLHSHDENDT